MNLNEFKDAPEGTHKIITYWEVDGSYVVKYVDKDMKQIGKKEFTREMIMRLGQR